jgi:hypothetical protein
MSPSHAETQRIESAYDAVEEHLRTPRSGLLWHWHLGHLLGRTRTAAGYGDAWAAAVKDRTGLARSTSYKTAQFAELCAEQEAARWNRRVSWSQMAVLLSVKEESQRTAILADTVRLKWGCRQVTAAVGRLHRNRLPSGGRPPQGPVSKGPARDVAALGSVLAGAVPLVRGVGAPLDALLTRRMPIPPRMRQKLDQVLVAAQELQPALAALVTELTEVVRRDDERCDPPGAAQLGA